MDDGNIVLGVGGDVMEVEEVEDDEGDIGDIRNSFVIVAAASDFNLDSDGFGTDYGGMNFILF